VVALMSPSASSDFVTAALFASPGPTTGSDN
jgi:hypothetical protein